MKTKKRIRAHHYYSDREGICYVVKQSDIRALAKQMVRSSVEWYKLPESAASDPRALAASLHCLKRAGMTPGKGAK